MKTSTKKISIILFSASLLFNSNAFAGRMGQGRSLGMQRNTSIFSRPSSNNYQSNRTSGYQPGAATTAQEPRRGPGIGGVVAGAAAGALGGYMLGKAMNSDKNASSQALHEEAVPSSLSNQIPWGLITILGLLLIIGLMLFRRRANPAINNSINPLNHGNNSFSIPEIRRNTSAPESGVSPPATFNSALDKMADGVETQYFLRQAKGMFLHIQSMNTPDNVTEVEKYMTPQLYSEVKQMISNNDFVADFSQLECQLLQSSIEDNNFVASVRFFGLVSESPNAPVVNFNEVWNFSKPAGIEGAKWVVAGIQQTNASTQ
jgi:predicted lipid-binding transport protein (Tim44 family)